MQTKLKKTIWSTDSSTFPPDFSHCVYCVGSWKKLRNGQTSKEAYIGASTHFGKRLDKHRGRIKGGAKRLRKHHTPAGSPHLLYVMFIIHMNTSDRPVAMEQKGRDEKEEDASDEDEESDSESEEESESDEEEEQKGKKRKSDAYRHMLKLESAMRNVSKAVVKAKYTSKQRDCGFGKLGLPLVMRTRLLALKSLLYRERWSSTASPAKDRPAIQLQLTHADASQKKADALHRWLCTPDPGLTPWAMRRIAKAAAASKPKKSKKANKRKRKQSGGRPKKRQRRS